MPKKSQPSTNKVVKVIESNQLEYKQTGTKIFSCFFKEEFLREIGTVTNVITTNKVIVPAGGLLLSLETSNGMFRVFTPIPVKIINWNDEFITFPENLDTLSKICDLTDKVKTEAASAL